MLNKFITSTNDPLHLFHPYDPTEFMVYKASESSPIRHARNTMKRTIQKARFHAWGGKVYDKIIKGVKFMLILFFRKKKSGQEYWNRKPESSDTCSIQSVGW